MIYNGVMREVNMASERFKLLSWTLDERLRRLFAAAEAKVVGQGGITYISKATGISRRAIHAGLDELESRESGAETEIKKGKIRKSGGGRKKVTEKDPKLKADLERLVEATTRGDPESPLRWTCKSLRMLADELKAQGHKVSYPVVGNLLHDLDYSLQGNVKTLEGSQHVDRNAQFEWINKKVQETQAENNPVISVDTKKKELVGPYKNGGRTWRPKGDPEEVKVHDFPDVELGRANPYGVYDLTSNSGWVSVGTDHDTASFAVETIRRWWKAMGKEKYPKADKLMTKLINEGKVDNLFCWKLDRLARNPIEAGIVTHLLQTRKISSIITPNNTFYPEDNAILTAVEFGMANQYSRDLRGNVIRGLKSKREKGWMPNYAPNGYLNERYNEKGLNRILEDPKRFKPIQKLWKLALTGNYSISDLADIINKQYKVKTKGGKEFSKSTLHRMFNNPFYYGYFKNKDTYVKGKHKPMVTKREFDELQTIFNKHKGRPQDSKAENKYNGLIKCGECGYTVIPEPLKYKTIKSTGKVKTYK